MTNIPGHEGVGRVVKGIVLAWDMGVDVFAKR